MLDERETQVLLLSPLHPINEVKSEKIRETFFSFGKLKKMSTGATSNVEKMKILAKSFQNEKFDKPRKQTRA